MINFQSQPRNRKRNKPLEGAIFLDADNRKVFGLISLDGQDRRIQAIIDFEQNIPMIRGGVDFDNRYYDLELRPVNGIGVKPTANQPAWQGFLLNQTDAQDRFQLAGWLNTSSGRGIRYLRLKAEPIGLPRARHHKAVLDAWSVLTGQDQNQIRLF
jgi:hypothetical protein